MAKFSKLDPAEVLVGRQKAAAAAREPYLAALRAGDAGRVELERGERPDTVKRLLADSARSLGVRIRSSWEDGQQRALLWKKVGK